MAKHGFKMTPVFCTDLMRKCHTYLDDVEREANRNDLESDFFIALYLGNKECNVQLNYLGSNSS